MGNEFRYELEQAMKISVSEETGVIVGRAEYTTAEDSYLLRYKAADGRAVEAWWSEGAIEAA